MDVNKSEFIGFMRQLGKNVDFDCLLVAAGGTALTLQNIKQATKDIDFVVERGDINQLAAIIKTIDCPPVDLFPPGMVFNNPLPSTYLSNTVEIGKFDKITLLALNHLDIVMTKIARADDGDMDDIRLCVNICSVNDILNAAQSHKINTPELRNNMRKVLKEVYGISYDKEEGDIR